jgi:hypothetical protein
MKQKIFSLMILLALAVSSVACAAQDVSGASNDTPADPSVSSSSGAVEDQASLVDALRAAGAEVELGDSVEQAFFSVEGQILKVNGADIQVFEYESAEAMETESSQISEDGGSIGTNMVTWVATPHFFRSGRLLVLYVGFDAAVLDLLEDALGKQFAGR